MNAYLNYFIEANAGLIFVLAFYLMFLRRETNFKFLRLFLLGGIFAALTFPLFHIEMDQRSSSPSMGQGIPSYWSPEVVIGEKVTVPKRNSASPSFRECASAIYFSGLLLGFIYVLIQLAQLIRVIRCSKTYRLHNLHISESTEDKPVFSFFNFIFIGRAHELSTQDKQQVILHESVHAQQWHSLDILLVNLLKVCFWFNPFINNYKNVFIRLHEFEADARTVETSDADRYCSLLARVALQSSDFKLANHFNNSLTVKRIQMIRATKFKVRQWKLIALGLVFPFLFFLNACQNPMDADVMEIAEDSGYASDVPENVQKRFDALNSNNPHKKFVLLELNEAGFRKLEKIQREYGLPMAIETLRHGFKGRSGSWVRDETYGVVLTNNLKKSRGKGEYSDIETFRKFPQNTFGIFEFWKDAPNISRAAPGEDHIYKIVEEAPSYRGGWDSLKEFMKRNLRYPRGARANGIVDASFIIEPDGSMTDVRILRGINQAYDLEAKRVIQILPPWIPGKQDGQAVRSMFVLKVNFRNATEE